MQTRCITPIPILMYHQIEEPPACGTALPVLRGPGDTATGYFVARHTAGSNFWDGPNGAPESPRMSLREMVDWAKAGNEAGVHTLDHADPGKLTPDAATDQIASSRAVLESLMDEPVEALRYPYGNYMPEHGAAVRAAGYASATTTARGRVLQGADRRQFRRSKRAHAA